MAAIFFCYVFRCSSTCWHLKTPARAQIHHRTKKPKTNSLFNQLNTSGPRGLVGSSVISDPAVPGSNSTAVNCLFLCHFFSQSEGSKNFKVFHMNGDGLRTCAPVKSIKTSQQVFIGFKNLPIGYYRKLKTCGQSMCSNGRLAIETSIKNLMRHKLSSHELSTQSSHFVDRAGWQAKMASIEFWIP